MSDFRSMQDMFNGTPDFPMPKQPLAIKLASFLEADARSFQTKQDAAAELRRLHEENERLKAALEQQPADEPIGRVISANCEYATVQWLKQTSTIGGGDPKNSRSWPLAGDAVYTIPQPAAWVGLTDEEKRDLVTNWFAEGWAIKAAIGMLDDYDTLLREKSGGKA